MPVISCKICGGDIELSPDRAFGICSYCGRAMTLPKIDDEQRVAAFNRGNYFRRIGEFDKALSVYERIVQEDESDAEAHWCCALCRFGIEYVEDPTTYEWFPTCHRLSFDSFLEDVDYLAALEHSDGITRRQYQMDAAKIAEVQRGIIANSQNIDPYDVFICYKETGEDGQRTRDSIMAQDIYYQLTEQGYRVFFSRITLEDVPGSEYEPYIFAALNSAKVMIVVGTSEANLNSVWVKNEWSRFLALMRKDHNKLLIPCYKDMDPYNLPEQLSILQSYDMGKIGFIQDLLHGVGKVLDAGRKSAPNVPASKANVGGSNVGALLKRGQMALEDGDWRAANEFFEMVLNQNPENAKAYIGKFLALAQQSNLDDLVQARLASTEIIHEKERVMIEPDKAHIEEMKKLAIPNKYSDTEIESEYSKFDLGYDSALNLRISQRKAEEEWWDRNKDFNWALKFASTEDREKLEIAKEMVLEEMDIRIEKEVVHDRDTEDNIREEYASFLDSTDANVHNKHDKIIRNRKTRNRVAYVVFACAVTYFAATEIVIPSYKSHIKYEQALAQLNDGDYEGAVRTFKFLRRYGDSQDQLLIAQQNLYEQALTLKNDGDYADAFDAFRILGDYEDSANQLSALRKILIKDIFASDNTGTFAEKFDLWGKVTERSTISAGLDYTICLLEDGSQAYTGDFSQYDNSTWQDVVAVSAGDYHAVGLCSDGTVVATGNSGDGRCDVNNWADIVSISAGDCHTVGLRSDGTVVATGDNEYGQCDVSDWTDIVSISAGAYHTVGLRSDGTVVATGNSESGRCDVGDWTDIVSISAGQFHTVGLRSDGTVVAVGSNRKGQCDVNDWTDIVSISAGAYHTVGLRSDGTVVAVGWDKYDQCDDVNDWTDIVSISAGQCHTVGLRSDGTAVAGGWNHDNQCDVSSWNDIRINFDN